MSNAKFVGRIGAMAAALEVGNVRRVATRATVSIGVAAVVVVATVVPASASTPDEPQPEEATALLVCGTTCPTFDVASAEIIMDQFIGPIYPDQLFKPTVRVTTPNEAWPITGIFRLLELALGDPRLGGPGGPAWPDEPLWKLSGLFDLTGDQSIEAGVADLEKVIAEHPNEHLVIYGYSQGAVVVGKERAKLAEQYPEGPAPDIDFVLAGDVNVPNGGFGARFPGLHIPILDWTYDLVEPTDTQFETTVITRQYDGFADFPLYPLNFVADLNAVFGLFYVHAWPFAISLADSDSAPVVSTAPGGNTTYYFFESQDLPLFAPLRTLGVPEPLIDVVEPFVREIVELGYDRSIPAWQPTPARLIPSLDPATVATDLVTAIGEGINNAAALFDAPVPLSLRAAPSSAREGAVESQPPASPAVFQDDPAPAAPRDIDQLADPGDQITQTISAAKSFIGNGHTIARSADNATASPTRKTPLRDAVTRARADVKRVVTQVRDGVKKTFAAARDKDTARPKRGAVGAP